MEQSDQSALARLLESKILNLKQKAVKIFLLR